MPEKNNAPESPVAFLDGEVQRKLQEISRRLDELAKKHAIHQENTLTKNDLTLSENKTNLQIGDVDYKIKEILASTDRFADLNTRFDDVEKRLSGLKVKKTRTPARSLRHLATAVSVTTILSAFIASWSAYETRRSANEARKAADVQIWFYLSSQYSSREMFAAMKKLRAYQIHNPKTFAADFKAGLINIDKLSKEKRQEIEDIDAARRHVSYFCGTLMVLDREGLMARRVIKDNWATTLYEFLIHVLDPLEQAKAEAMCSTAPCSQERLDEMKISKKTRIEFFDPKKY